MEICSNSPGPALPICSPTSYSFVIGFPKTTLDNCETVLLTDEYNLFITSIVADMFEKDEKTKGKLQKVFI